MRETRTFGRNAVVELEVYNKCKYMMDEDAEIRRVKFEISSWEIVDGQDAEEIEAHTDGSCIDDYHEYLVLHLTNGETATFRNSYVDMFRISWVA